MSKILKETKQVTKTTEVVTGLQLDQREAYILAAIATANRSNARVIAKNMKGALAGFGLKESDLVDFFTKIEDPLKFIPEGLPKVVGFKVGDKVRVVRKVEGYANGWNNTWASSMDSYVNDGEVYEVWKDLGATGLRLNGSIYSWPPEALELVTEASEVDFKVGDRVKVVAPETTGGAYRGGDEGVITGFPGGNLLYVSFDRGYLGSYIVYPREVVRA